MASVDYRFPSVAIFMNGSNQAVRIPTEMSYPSGTRLEVRKIGDVLMLQPERPTWESFHDLPPGDGEFLNERPDVLELGRVDFTDHALDA